MNENLQLEDFDSKEEWQFHHWLLEAEKADLIYNITYHPESYLLSEKASIWTEKKLKTKTKNIEKFLLHPHSYQIDFKFKIKNKLMFEFLQKIRIAADKEICIDVKGNFAGKNNSTAVTFPLNQKWIYQQYGIYVQKIVPDKLFKATWIPEACRLTPKKKQPVKKYIKFKSISEFLSKSKQTAENI